MRHPHSPGASSSSSEHSLIDRRRERGVRGGTLRVSRANVGVLVHLINVVERIRISGEPLLEHLASVGGGGRALHQLLAALHEHVGHHGTVG